MGLVYRVKDRLNQEIIALKYVTSATEFEAHVSTDNQIQLRLSLAKEFKVLASIRHPNIISVLDYGFDEQQIPYITMNLLENAQDLKQATKAQALELQVGLLIDLLLAVDYLHRRNILHRDLKPSNVMVVNGHVKVLDFGLAEVGNIAKGRAGTLAYMAPETLKKGIALQQSDLYSIGIMMYEIILNQLPYNPIDINARINYVPNVSNMDGHPLSNIISRLLLSDPEDRYTNARDVIHAICEATQISPPEETQELRESYLQTASFIGRKNELLQLENALDDAMSGNGSAWLIGGESGIGKTRLIDELRIRALVKGTVVLRGYGSHFSALPYQLWRDILPRLILTNDVSEHEASVLKELVPNIEQILGQTVPDASEIEGEAHKQRLLHILSTVLQRQSKTLVIVLEDLQWLVESLDVLKHLLKFVQKQNWLIVASFRNDERPELATELASMRYLQLNRFEDEQIAELSRAMLGEVGIQTNVLDLLKRETEGNVFFMVEVVRALAEEAGRLNDIGLQTLPNRVFAGGIQQILERRIAQVPEELQDTMKLAAIAGREINRDILSAAVTDTILDEWLIAASRAVVLDIEDNQWRFAHDKLRETILDNLKADERPLLYRRIAQSIEAVYPEDMDYAPVLANSWIIAEDMVKGLYYILAASEQYINILGNYHQALELLQRGLNLLKSNKLSESDFYRSQFLYLTGLAYMNISDYPQAIEAFQDGLAMPQVASNVLVKLHNGLCLTFWFVENYQQAQDHAQQALELAKKDNNQEGMTRSLDLLGRITYAQGSFDIARSYYEQSIEIGWRINDLLSITQTLTNIGMIYFREADYDIARNYLEQSLQILREEHFIWGLAHTLSTLGIIARATGNYQLALKYLEESLHLRRESGDIQGVAISLNNLAAVQHLLEDYDTSQIHYQESLAIFEEIDNQRNAAYVLKNLGDVAYTQGTYEIAHDYHMRSLQLRREIGDQWGVAFSLGYVAQSYAALKQPTLAKEALIEGLELGKEQNKIACTLHLLISAARFMFHQNQFEQAVEWICLAQENESLPAPHRAQTENLMAKLKNTLNESAFNAASDRGRHIDIETILFDLLAVFNT